MNHRDTEGTEKRREELLGEEPRQLCCSSFPLKTSVLSSLCSLCLCGSNFGAEPKKGPAKVTYDEHVKPLFVNKCIACHNPDPSQDGTLGPAIKGSNAELVKARVMRGEYPAGYTPKRATHIMVKLPLEESDVAAVAAYLNAP